MAERKNINELANDSVQMDLFIQSLKAMMELDPSDPVSYFALAGIHGLPPQPWDGVESPLPKPKRGAGYCHHHDLLFANWHTPYMLQFENSLWIQAQKIADEYQLETKHIYRNAALKLRLPFWDWALDPVPSIMNKKEVTVNSPKGNVTIMNPLFAYIFQTDLMHNDTSVHISKTSVTHPNENYSITNTFIEHRKRELCHSIWRKRTPTDEAPVNAVWEKSILSDFETVHDNIHGGAGGTMSSTATAGFHPIFWLHHNNVERQFVLWQLMNPETQTVGSGKASRPSYMFECSSGAKCAVFDDDTKLYPFRTNASTFITARESFGLGKKYNYMYAEEKEMAGKTSNDVKDFYARKYDCTIPNEPEWFLRIILKDTGVDSLNFDVYVSNLEREVYAGSGAIFDQKHEPTDQNVIITVFIDKAMEALSTNSTWKTDIRTKPWFKIRISVGTRTLFVSDAVNQTSNFPVAQQAIGLRKIEVVRAERYKVPEKIEVVWVLLNKP